MPEPSAKPAAVSAAKPEVAATPATPATDARPAKKVVLSSEVVVELFFPINLGGVETKKLTMRRPKVRDRMTLVTQGADNEVTMETLLIGNLCGVAPSEMEQMDMLDYRVLQGKLESFTNPLLLKS